MSADRPAAGPPPIGESQVARILEETGALRSGHFLLRSGLHSDRFFQCAAALQHPAQAARLCGELGRRLREAGLRPAAVLSPALGGIVVGHELARSLGCRSIFAEKSEGRLVLRRGFSIDRGEPVVIAEDVVTRGGRVRETLEIARVAGGEPLAVAVLIDRSGGAAEFGIPFFSLLRATPETWARPDCPLCRGGAALEKPGS